MTLLRVLLIFKIACIKLSYLTTLFRSEGLITKKLDRVLIHDNWLTAFPDSSVEFLPPSVSDHCPAKCRIVLNTSFSLIPIDWDNHDWERKGKGKGRRLSGWKRTLPWSTNSLEACFHDRCRDTIPRVSAFASLAREVNHRTYGPGENQQIPFRERFILPQHTTLHCTALSKCACSPLLPYHGKSLWKNSDEKKKEGVKRPSRPNPSH